ncbi:IclR family transcriptional regulator [Ramlibacter sp. G-1-2-2]|uniref:IclR family transcriptional regulator n=1 Tax=Ramlibacter agri TaxID=2728837 RepID=A0A848H6G0_9BURK|nr:IclR family transcriptional regulator [Ramlibacter agri]NML44153.1 IclR family transcriptional regulator [Ramlibacter agri]
MASPAGTQLIARSATLLRLIANSNHQGARLVDLALHSGLERPTVRRILQGLIAEGMVRQQDGDHRYLLGHLTYELGLAAARGIDMPRIAAASLDRIAQATGDTVYLVQRSGLDSVCIDRREGPFPDQVRTIDVGARRPLGAAVGGLALLASVPEDECSSIVELNRTQFEPYEKLYGRPLEEAVRDARGRGYALMPVNVLPYMSGVGVALPAVTGTPHTALSVSALSNRLMEKERHREVALLLQQEARIVASACAALGR